MMRARLVTGIGLLVLAGLVPACGGAVSNHDNRIFTTAASRKLAANELTVGYVLNPKAADETYRGHVLEVSGVVASVEAASNRLVMVGGDPVVWATLHDDVAAEALKTVQPGQRVTLKCFCEGLDTQVHLKSCILPDSSR